MVLSPIITCHVLGVGLVYHHSFFHQVEAVRKVVWVMVYGLLRLGMFDSIIPLWLIHSLFLCLLVNHKFCFVNCRAFLS